MCVSIHDNSKLDFKPLWLIYTEYYYGEKESILKYISSLTSVINI